MGWRIGQGRSGGVGPRMPRRGTMSGFRIGVGRAMAALDQRMRHKQEAGITSYCVVDG